VCSQSLFSNPSLHSILFFCCHAVSFKFTSTCDVGFIPPQHFQFSDNGVFSLLSPYQQSCSPFIHICSLLETCQSFLYKYHDVFYSIRKAAKYHIHRCSFSKSCRCGSQAPEFLLLSHKEDPCGSRAAATAEHLSDSLSHLKQLQKTDKT